MINGHEIRSLTGSHVNGAPLAVARPPADDLRPWLSWITVTNLEIPQGQTVHCATLSDQPCLRLMRSEEHTSELQSLMRISYAVFCLKKKTTHNDYNGELILSKPRYS